MNTPRTDPYDGIWASRFVNGQSIFEHARQLERELNDANKRIEELEKKVSQLIDLASKNDDNWKDLDDQKLLAFRQEYMRKKYGN
jgi:phage shock protein A